MGQPLEAETGRRPVVSTLATAHTIEHTLIDGRPLHLTIKPDISADTASLLLHLHDQALQIDHVGHLQLTLIAAGQPPNPNWDGRLMVKPLMDLRPERKPDRALLEMIDYIVLHAVVAAVPSNAPFPD